jgi:hypothetical protein
MRMPLFWLKFWGRVGPRRALRIVEADTPPKALPARDLILAREDGDNWAVAMSCPCGCGDRLELFLVEEAKPHWKLRSSDGEPPTLHPSVWRQTGCKAHFWVREGKIVWC